MEDADQEGFEHLRGKKSDAGSPIKTVASGRYGVSANYLQNCETIEIKGAQGGKPVKSENMQGALIGGFLNNLRFKKNNVNLKAPPPHHDLYSIEDLAQLIYDLHEVNQKAKVCVKLVTEAGIGTIASGVVKTNADVIQISGHEWDMGIIEVHQTLTGNKLRERV
jgi:glutamate synthase (ferredoxin)